MTFPTELPSDFASARARLSAGVLGVVSLLVPLLGLLVSPGAAAG
jgi:hypothetical protein